MILITGQGKDILCNWIYIPTPRGASGGHRIVKWTSNVRDPVSMGKYGYERIGSGLAPVVQITEPVSMDHEPTVLTCPIRVH